MCPKYFISLLLLLAVFHGNSRAQSPSVHAEAGVAAGFSHTGYHLSLLVPIHYGNHAAYGGPKLLLTESYLPYRNVWGIHMGYAYRILDQQRWKGDVALDYQCSFYRAQGYNASDRHNRIQELHLMLGLSYHPHPEARTAMKLQLGSGLYADTWHDYTEDRKRTGMGRAAAARFTVSYTLFKTDGRHASKNL